MCKCHMLTICCQRWYKVSFLFLPNAQCGSPRFLMLDLVFSELLLFWLLNITSSLDLYFIPVCNLFPDSLNLHDRRLSSRFFQHAIPSRQWTGTFGWSFTNGKAGSPSCSGFHSWCAFCKQCVWWHAICWLGQVEWGAITPLSCSVL